VNHRAELCSKSIMAAMHLCRRTEVAIGEIACGVFTEYCTKSEEGENIESNLRKPVTGTRNSTRQLPEKALVSRANPD
jgi:hypothetical protein